MTVHELSPEAFRDELDRATDSPPPAWPGRELTHGRQLLRRRRAVTVAASTLVAMVLAGGVAVGLDGGPGVGRDRSTQLTDQPPARTADYLESCRSGNQADVSTAAVFGAGTPIVQSVVRTDFQVVLALESADGSAWAECWIHLKSAEFASGMTVYSARADHQRTGTGLTSGLGCAMDADARDTCRSWFASTVDRLPAEVAAVRYGLGDGREVTVRSHDGFVVLNVLGEVPASVTSDFTEWGPGGDFDPVPTITYLDAAGQPIASEGRDAPAGLPKLKAYPSLKGEEIY